MSILSWLVLGLIAGWLAGQFMKGSGYGIVGDIVMGIIGAFVGGFIASVLFHVDVSGLNIPSIIISFVGACIVIAVYRALTGTRRSTVM